MDWIWVAIPGIAALLTAIWGFVQLITTWSPHNRYQQWSAIRRDYREGTPPWAYSDRQCRRWLIEIGARRAVLRYRAQAVAVYIVGGLVCALILVTANSVRDWLAEDRGAAVALSIVVVFPAFVTWIRSNNARAKAVYEIFGEKLPGFWKRLFASESDALRSLFSGQKGDG